MAQNQNALGFVAETAADLSAKTYYAGRINTSGQVQLCGAGERCDGIIWEGADGSSAAAPVRLAQGPVVEVILGGSVTAMTFGVPDANGKFVSGSWYQAAVIFLSSGSANNIIKAVFVPPGMLVKPVATSAGAADAGETGGGGGT